MTPAERPDVGMSLITTKEYRTLLKEADRSLLLDAALRALVEAWDAFVKGGPFMETGDQAQALDYAWDVARRALAATDVRGALAEAIERACADHNEECWFRKSSGIGADAILDALAAKGVEG